MKVVKVPRWLILVNLLGSELCWKGFYFERFGYPSIDSVDDQDVSSQTALQRSSAVFPKPRKRLSC